MSKRKHISIYKKSLIVFTLLLLIFGEGVLIYVNSSLKEYEKGDINNYLNSLLEEIKKSSMSGNIEKYFELSSVQSDYETNPSLKKGYKDLMKDAKLSYEKTKDKNVYDLYADSTKIATVTLDGSKVEHRLSLLTFNKWEIESMESYNDKGLFQVEAYLTSDYDLYINDKKVEEKDILSSEKIKEYEEVYDKVDLPKLNHYKIEYLTRNPKVEVKDKDGKKVEATLKDNVYYVNDYYKTDSYEDAMKHLNNEYDPLVFAKNWSLFLSDDLPGIRHGLYTLTPNLIEGTKMYQKAYNWATQVDVTFTSIHTLDKETFTNPKVSNFTVYNENAFSAEVYLEKNMTLIDRQKRQIVLHEMIYFVYYDGAYRVMHMQSVV